MDWKEQKQEIMKWLESSGQKSKWEHQQVYADDIDVLINQIIKKFDIEKKFKSRIMDFLVDDLYIDVNESLRTEKLKYVPLFEEFLESLNEWLEDDSDLSGSYDGEDEFPVTVKYLDGKEDDFMDKLDSAGIEYDDPGLTDNTTINVFLRTKKQKISFRKILKIYMK